MFVFGDFAISQFSSVGTYCLFVLFFYPLMHVWVCTVVTSLNKMIYIPEKKKRIQIMWLNNCLYHNSVCVLEKVLVFDLLRSFQVMWSTVREVQVGAIKWSAWEMRVEVVVVVCVCSWFKIPFFFLFLVSTDRHKQKNQKNSKFGLVFSDCWFLNHF